MPTATMTTKGQLTIPKEIREFLHLHPGDQILFRIVDQEKVILEPAIADPMNLVGCLHDPNRSPVQVEEMNHAIQMHWKKNDRV